MPASEWQRSCLRQVAEMAVLLEQEDGPAVRYKLEQIHSSGETDRFIVSIFALMRQMAGALTDAAYIEIMDDFIEEQIMKGGF